MTDWPSFLFWLECLVSDPSLSVANSKYSSVMSLDFTFSDVFRWSLFWSGREHESAKLNLKMHIPKQKTSSAGTWGRFPTATTVFDNFSFFQQAALNRNYLGVFINIWCIYRVYCSISAQTFAMSFWKHILIVRICSENLKTGFWTSSHGLKFPFFLE